MHCELCGREIERGYVVLIEGAKLVVCEECAERGEVVGRVGKWGGRKVEKRREEGEEWVEVVEGYGGILRRERERRGWDLKRASQALGVSESYLRGMEEGRLKPTLEVAERVEKVYGVRILREGVDEGADLGRGRDIQITLGDVVKVR